MRTIYCRSCDSHLHVEAFYAKKVTPGTKRSRCKACSSKSARRWALEHPDRAAANNARRVGTPRYKASGAAWRRKNRAKQTEYLRVWRIANPERANEIAARWRKRNPEKRAIWARERKILEGRALPRWADRKALHAIYVTARQLTKETGVDYHVDHVIPLRGKNVCGLHVETNLRVITGHENRVKFNKFEEALL